MDASDFFLFAMLISVLGILVFIISAIINFIKRKDAKTEWKRVAIFMGLTFLFFALFGLSIS